MKQPNKSKEICLFHLIINSIYIPALSVCLLVFMMGCNKYNEPDNKTTIMNNKNTHISDKTRNALESTKDKSIIFFHHSVGENILNGLRGLAEESGVGIKIQTVRNEPISNETELTRLKKIIDITGGKNGQPKTKVDSFVEQIKNLNSNVVPDIAFMKFCYVDFNPYTNVNELFSYYKQKIELLKKERPDIKLAHFTVPLFEQPNSIKDKINRFLGRLVWEDSTNIKRAEFNKLLFETFPQDPIFDIARIESTLPDGTRSSFEKDGNTYYSLASEYTDDGGHLNAPGQRRAAIEIAEFLAKIPHTKK